MKILYTITYYSPHNSGLTRGLEVIAQHFVAQGNDVEVLAARHDPTLDLKQEKVHGLTITRVPVAMRLRKGLIMPLHALKVWRSLANKDLVHIIAPQFDAGITALLARVRGKPVILSYVCSFNSPGLIGALTTFVLRLSHGVAGFYAHRIVALSSDYADQSRFCRLFQKKLHFVDVPVPNFPSHAKPYKPAKPPYRIGFVGRISKDKNIDLLIDALPAIREELDAPFTLEIVGPDEPAGTPDAERLQWRIAACEDNELIRVGVLTEEDLVKFYEDIDVLVLPSVDRIEAYGMVQVEAMLRGTPCVTSDLPGMRQPIVRTGFGRLFEAGMPVALARSIADVLRHGPERQPTTDELFTIFDNANIFSEFGELYREACGYHLTNT